MARGRGRTRSLRIEEDVYDSLQEFAGKEEITANAAINRALRSFFEWHKQVNTLHLLPMPSDLLVRLVDPLSEDEIRTIGAWVGTGFMRDFSLHTFKTFSPETLARSLEVWDRLGGRALHITHRQQSNRHRLVLRQPMGRKWSIFYGALLNEGLKSAGATNIRVEESDNQVLAEFST